MGNPCKPFYQTIDEGAEAFTVAEMFISMFNLLMSLYIYLEVVVPITRSGSISITQRIVLTSAIILMGTLILQSMFGFMLFILGWKRRNVTICMLWTVSAIPNIVLPWFILVFGSCDSVFQKLSVFKIWATPKSRRLVARDMELATEPCTSTTLDPDEYDDYMSGRKLPQDPVTYPEGYHMHCGYWSPLFLYLLYPLYGIWIMIAFIQWARTNRIATRITFGISNIVEPAPITPSPLLNVNPLPMESKNPDEGQLAVEMIEPEVNANLETLTELLRRSSTSSLELQSLCRLPDNSMKSLNDVLFEM